MGSISLAGTEYSSSLRFGLSLSNVSVGSAITSRRGVRPRVVVLGSGGEVGVNEGARLLSRRGLASRAVGAWSLFDRNDGMGNSSSQFVLSGSTAAGFFAGVDRPRTALTGASDTSCLARKTSETSSPSTLLSSEFSDPGSVDAAFFFVVVGCLAFTSRFETGLSKVFFLGMTLLNYGLNPLQ